MTTYWKDLASSYHLFLNMKLFQSLPYYLPSFLVLKLHINKNILSSDFINHKSKKSPNSSN